MKAWIDENGILYLCGENATEDAALLIWGGKRKRGERNKICLGVSNESPFRKEMERMCTD